MDSLKNKAISGIFWQGLERFGIQCGQFIVTILLARLLTPEDFSVIALTTVFISLSQLLIDNSLGQALIQKKTVEKSDENFVFWCGLSIAFVTYGVVHLCAPYVAEFYQMEILTPILRWLGIGLIFYALQIVPQALLSKQLLFQKKFLLTLISSISAMAVGLTMAFSGCGVWSLVGQQLAASIGGVIGIFVVYEWRPGLTFNFSTGKTLFQFSSKLLCANLLNTVCDNLYPMIIGKLFPPATLGYFNRANRFVLVIITSLCGTLNSVFFPIFSQVQHEPETMKEMLRKVIRISAFFVFPAMLLFSASSEAFVVVLLSDKWRPTIAIMQILSLAYMFYPINILHQQCITAMGKSGLFLKMEIFRKGLFVIILLISLRGGIIGISWGIVILSAISLFIVSWPNRKLLNYRFKEQFRDIFPAMATSSAMFTFLWLLNFLIDNLYIRLPVQILGGMLFYLFWSFIFRVNALQYLFETIAYRYPPIQKHEKLFFLLFRY